MRRLLYCGEWIESHALHVFLLHAPDFLGYDGAIEMAADHPPVVERGLRMKKAGNDLMTLVGGRSIHPVNVRIGGFYRMPSRAELRALRPGPRAGARRRARDGAAGRRVRLPRLRAALRVPRAAGRARLPDRVRQRRDLVGRRLRGARLPRAHRGVARRRTRNALHATPRRVDRGPYVVGPLARYTLNHDRLSPMAQRGRRARPGWARRAATRSARSSCAPSSSWRPAHEALRIIDGWTGRRRAERAGAAPGGEGFGASEAPRGVLFHRYVLDDDGHHPRRADRAADVAEPAQHRGRPPLAGRGLDRPRRPRAPAPVRARDPQLRPLHLLRHPLPRPHRGRGRDGATGLARLGLVVGLGSPTAGTTPWARRWPAPWRTLRLPGSRCSSTRTRPPCSTSGRATTPSSSWTPCAPADRPARCTSLETGAGRAPLPERRLGRHRARRDPRLRPGGGGRARPGRCTGCRRAWSSSVWRPAASSTAPRSSAAVAAAVEPAADARARRAEGGERRCASVSWARCSTWSPATRRGARRRPGRETVVTAHPDEPVAPATGSSSTPGSPSAGLRPPSEAPPVGDEPGGSA